MTSRSALAAIRGAVPLVVLLLLFEAALRSSVLLSGFLEGVGIGAIARELLATILVFALINLPLVAAERVWPGTADPRRYWDGAKFWLISLVVAFAWFKAVVWLRTQWHLTPLIDWKVGAESPLWIGVLGILLPILLFDGLYYGFHRAQHRFAVLWRFHRVHHSIVSLNCVNSYHHALEEVMRFPFIALPLALLINIDAPRLFLLSAAAAGWSQYIHSDTAVHLGRWHTVFADNAYHRIHHSVIDRHFHRNFAAFFSLWDRLFGTYQAPERGPLPPVGLVGTPPPASVREYLLAPLRK